MTRKGLVYTGTFSLRDFDLSATYTVMYTYLKCSIQFAHAFEIY